MPRIHFPKDEGVHPDYMIEWWYVHFNLTDSGGREYGAMAAYFNLGLKILAVSDLEGEKYHHVVSGSPLHSTEGSFELRWGVRDQWYRTDRDSYSYNVESYGTDIGLNLDLHSRKPPLLGCGNGLVKWTGGTSYYYQLTRLQVKGTLELPGRTLDVTGLGVMDHQWMNYLGRGGWNWFCVQLDNDIEIVFWQIVNPDESVKHRNLTIMFPDSSVYNSGRFKLERRDTWVSPESGREYGIVWRVREKTRGLDLELRARYPQQEVRMFQDLHVYTFPFWEGSMVASGHLDGEAVSGTGFAEFVRTPDEMK